MLFLKSCFRHLGLSTIPIRAIMIENSISFEWQQCRSIFPAHIHLVHYFWWGSNMIGMWFLCSISPRKNVSYWYFAKIHRITYTSLSDLTQMLLDFFSCSTTIIWFNFLGQKIKVNKSITRKNIALFSILNCIIGYVNFTLN